MGGKMTFRNPDAWPVEGGRVSNVNVYDEGGVAVTWDKRWTFWISPEELEASGRMPQVGDWAIVLGGIGQEIRGIFVGPMGQETEYRYLTYEEAEAKRAQWLLDYENEKQTQYRNNINEWLIRSGNLDRPFRARIDRFAAADTNFWKDDGGYELFCVEQANKLYRVALTKADPAGWLDKFAAASYDEQKQMFPGLGDGHSGNTFGGMVGLAKAVAAGQPI
jgi:hypothetical protein